MKPRTTEAETAPYWEEARVYWEESDAQAEVLDGPPNPAEVWFQIRDREAEYRGYISIEGECYSNTNQLIGFINSDEGTCGSATEEYLGACVNEVSGSEIVIEDAVDEQCCVVNLGTMPMAIKDSDGQFTCEVDGEGRVLGQLGNEIGRFDGDFSFKDIRVIALYMALLDPGFASSREE